VRPPRLDGLEAGHRQGIVHRDLKPSNLFLSADFAGRVVPKLLDFGVSKILQISETMALTISGATLGTPQYMAPEQIEGAGQVDARADQFAMALVLWECIAGRPAREGGSPFRDAGPGRGVADSAPAFRRVRRRPAARSGSRTSRDPETGRPVPRRSRVHEGPRAARSPRR
jgi:serine/threonine protein kinase